MSNIINEPLNRNGFINVANFYSLDSDSQINILLILDCHNSAEFLIKFKNEYVENPVKAISLNQAMLGFVNESLAPVF